MPLPPNPITYICPACRWKRSVIPQSDCLINGIDWFEYCPDCHHSLDFRPATQREILVAKLRRLMP